MGTYLYECNPCQEEFEIIKSMSESNNPEFCTKCQKPLDRIFTAPRLNTSVAHFEAHFNHGLGVEVHKKADITNALKRINGETGKNIVEIGNDNLKSVKKHRKAYTLD